MEDVLVCKSGELGDGAVRIVYHGQHEVAVIRHGTKYYAYANLCPHQGGPACEGIRVPQVVDVVGADGEFLGQRYDETDVHIVCPWHGYEFHLETGEHAGDKKLKLRKYKVSERGGAVYVSI